MSSSRVVLEDYVTNILDGNDEDIQDLSIKYENYYLSSMETLNFTQETFGTGIEVISNELFSLRKVTEPYVVSLLIFSIELDKFYKLHSWYTRDMLIRIIVNILYKREFKPNNRCIILYILVLSFLTLEGNYKFEF